MWKSDSASRAVLKRARVRIERENAGSTPSRAEVGHMNGTPLAMCCAGRGGVSLVASPGGIMVTVRVLILQGPGHNVSSNERGWQRIMMIQVGGSKKKLFGGSKKFPHAKKNSVTQKVG